MFQTQAVSPITFRFRISMQGKIIQTSSCSEKSGKTDKNAPSVTGGQRAVTLHAGVQSMFPYLLNVYQKRDPTNLLTDLRLKNIDMI